MVPGRVRWARRGRGSSALEIAVSASSTCIFLYDIQNDASVAARPPGSNFAVRSLTAGAQLLNALDEQAQVRRERSTGLPGGNRRLPSTGVHPKKLLSRAAKPIRKSSPDDGWFAEGIFPFQLPWR